jgi:hypothetical protein
MEAPDIPTAWRRLIDRTPGTRQGDPVMIQAAYQQPRLRELYPFPTHGTLRFLRAAPPPFRESDSDLPLVICGEPPYKVYAFVYAKFLGEAATPEEAAALLVEHLPPDAGVLRS